MDNSALVCRFSYAALLLEIHWLLENTGTRFVLCGSSARKLRRESLNLLGGRAIDHHLLPLTSHEIGDVDLPHLLAYGALPPHYFAPDPRLLLKAYVNNYIKQEIIDESVTRNIPAFSRFLQVAGISHGQQINFSNFARETGVSAGTVRNYYQIVQDTLLASRSNHGAAAASGVWLKRRNFTCSMPASRTICRRRPASPARRSAALSSTSS